MSLIIQWTIINNIQILHEKSVKYISAPSGNLSVWLLLVYILEGIHQGDTSADTCCKYNTNHTTYTCRGCGMKDVPKQIDGKVTTFDLAQNNLTSLKDDVFLNLTKLINLYLNNNQISHISRNALRGLKNLNELDLRRNKLCINDSKFNGIFNATPHLKTLQMVKRYAHLSDAHTAGVVTRMNEKIFGAAL